MPAELGAVLVPMVTPFDPSGGVDEESAVRLMHHLVEHGADGLVICGTTGEAATMTEEEQLGIIALAVQEMGDRCTIVGQYDDPNKGTQPFVVGENWSAPAGWRRQPVTVPSPAGWTQAGLPKALDGDQVAALLACCDLLTRTGRRDLDQPNWHLFGGLPDRPHGSASGGG